MRSWGIDFGTSNSVVAALTDDGPEVQPIGDPPFEWTLLGDFSRVLPSVFAVGPNREPLFGWTAKSEPHAISAVKRALGSSEYVELAGTREQYTVEKVAAYVFRFLRERVEETAFTDLRSAVVTIPANSRGLARKRTKVAAGMAGIRVLALMNEPTAAALAAASRQPGERVLLVYDWGGGTLDVTLLHAVDGVFVEMASKGIPKLGGIDVDNALLQFVKEQAGPAFEHLDEEQRARLRLDLERHKIELSSGGSVTTVHVPGVPGGIDIQREDLDRLTRPIVERTIEPINTVLADASLRAQDVDEIVLAGGSSALPLVRELLAQTVGTATVADVDPLTAIAEGAAIAAGILNGELPTHDLVLSIEHALGTVATDGDGREFFSPIIARNTKLPVQERRNYVPRNDNQPKLVFRVVEGDPDVHLEHGDNVVLAEWEVELDPPRPRDEAAFDAHISYDRDGIIHVRLTDQHTGREIHAARVDFVGGRDLQDLTKIAQEVEQGFRESSVEPDRVLAEPPTVPEEPVESEAASPGPRLERDDQALLLHHARDIVIPHLRSSDAQSAEEIERLCSLLERLSGSPDAQRAAGELDDRLRPYTFLF